MQPALKQCQEANFPGELERNNQNEHIMNVECMLLTRTIHALSGTIKHPQHKYLVTNSVAHPRILGKRNRLVGDVVKEVLFRHPFGDENPAQKTRLN